MGPHVNFRWVSFCPKSVSAAGGPFDPGEPVFCALICRHVFILDHKMLVTCISAQFPILHIFQRHSGFWHANSHDFLIKLTLENGL